MTPLKLQEAIEKELQELFKDYAFPGGKKLNTYRQFLPDRKKQKDDFYYPYAQVILDDGEETEEGATQSVVLIFGVKAPTEYEGFTTIANMIQITREHFLTKLFIGDLFEVKKGIRWINAGDDSPPCYIGGMSLDFIIPAIEYNSKHM